MPKEQQRICMANSLYCFMYYLFLCKEKQIDDTVYFFTKDIPTDVQQHMPHKHFVDKQKWYFSNNYAIALYWAVFRNRKYPDLKHADIYGLDFNWWLLRGLKMSYIEDAPYVLDAWEGSSLYRNYKDFRNSSFIKRNLATFLFGEYYRRPVGTSDYVTAIYTSAPFDKPYHAGKKKIVMPLREAWESFSESKKKRILNIFNVDDDCLRQLNSRSVILLTQPYAADCHMTEKEQIETYRMIAQNYRTENVIIKPHPRDKCDYKSLIPDVMIFDKIIPMQLLVLLGAKFERIATINSSSALSFGKDAHIDWWAEKMDKDIVKKEGILTLAEAKKTLSNL